MDGAVGAVKKRARYRTVLRRCEHVQNPSASVSLKLRAAEIQNDGSTCRVGCGSPNVSGAPLTATLPPIVCVIGKKKSGKTTTTVGLVRELVARGHRVMTAKHGHGFELDTEGTDSFRHRHDGGADRVVMAGPEQMAVVGGWGASGELALDDLVARYLADADVVVAEGFKTARAPSIEVYRHTVHEHPLYGHDPAGDAAYLAVLTDVAGFDAHVPVLDINAPGRFAALADLIEATLLPPKGGL